MLIPLQQMVAQYAMEITGVVHCGAHLGEEAEAYAAQGLRGRVLWIEGNEALIPDLRANVARYGHEVACALLGARPGMVTLHIASNGESSSVLDLGTHETEHPEVTYVGQTECRVETLDTVAERHGVSGYNMLNLDLQGYELEALRGGERVLQDVHYLYTEVNEAELYRDCVQLPELDEWLGERDFQRVKTEMTRHGWGDALYIRVPD